jgi:DUF2934 family protein
MSTAARAPELDPPPIQLDDTTMPVPEFGVSEGRPTPEDIAREAYLIYLANGEQHGRADDDWYEAERRLLGAPRQSRQGNATPQQAAAQLSEVDSTLRTPG